MARIRDFTIDSYKLYLRTIKRNFENNLRFDEYMKLKVKPDNFFLIRHDVDRKLLNSIKMAEIEYEMGVKASYYFRMKSHTFSPEIIKKIKGMGHEVGYHYECLSDSNGNLSEALEEFKINLSEFRKYSKISTISMHGVPLKSYDNRDMWRNDKNHKMLVEELGILGELYLDIDYSEINYVNDTGRNWQSNAYNIRDRVNSNVSKNYHSGNELLLDLKNKKITKLVFQIHPERWAHSRMENYLQELTDMFVNIVKVGARIMRGKN